MNKLRILELFGGIGSCSKALERLGIDYEIADYVEIDKYAVKSFNAIHNTNFEPQDITKWDKDIEVDLIMHGSPCQDFSLAGKQAGGDKDSGTRSSLMYETIRIVEKLKPKYVIWENVKNLLSKKHRHNFDAYLETMESLGYKNYYQVLNAKDYGIPQNRERVFTVSIRNDIDTLFEFPPKQELKLKLKDMLENEVDEKYYLSDKMIQYITADNEKWTGNNDKSVINKSIASAINTGEGSRRCDASNYISNELKENFNLKIKNNTKKGYLEAHDGVVIKKDTNNYVEWEEKGKFDSDCRTYKEDKISGAIMTTPKNKVLLKEKLCNNLIENGKVQEYDVIRHSYSNSRMKDWENRNIEKHNEVPTLDTRCDCLGVAVNQPPLRIRKLTPKECWRLMGFDDEDYEKAAQVNSNTQLYKQAGNSIVVNVLMAIFKKLFGLIIESERDDNNERNTKENH